MIYYVDIDGTICTQENKNEASDYSKAEPRQNQIAKINKLYDEGHTIVYWTARGTLTQKMWFNTTLKQLQDWGCKFHELRMGKPAYDLFIDDKNINSEEFILDVGKGMREKFSKIKSKNVETLDANQYDGYPDIIFDLCDELDESLNERYDKIICLAILEHVYNPFLAVDNLKKMLKKKGIIYGYVPYLNYYHAPNDLKFQDYFLVV